MTLHEDGTQPDDAEPALHGELEEVLQEDTAVPAVPVTVEGPVETRELPALKASAFNTFISDVQAEKISGRDLKRKRAVLLTLDGNFIYGTDRTAVERGYGFIQVQNVPLELRNGDAIYVRCRFPGTIVLSVLLEQWAD